MSAQEVLNQDEIDALLNGVDAGAVSTEPEVSPHWHQTGSSHLMASGSPRRILVLVTRMRFPESSVT